MRGRLWGRLAEISHKTFELAQIAFLVLSTLLVAAWIVTPARNWLQTRFLFDQESVFGIIALSMTFVLGSLVALQRDLRQVARSQEQQAAVRGLLIEDGVRGVYEHLNRTVDGIKSRKERHLQVLGLTLNSAWPVIHPWLEKEETRDWTVELCCLAPQAIQDHGRQLNAEWARKAGDKADEIQKYLATAAGKLGDRKNGVSFRTYDVVPALHGFKLGNGCLFVSFCHWSRETGVFDEPHQFYEVFPAEDRSSRAAAYRALFDNWFARCWKGPPAAMARAVPALTRPSPEGAKAAQ